jgi:hypothetical protein
MIQQFATNLRAARASAAVEAARQRRLELEAVTVTSMKRSRVAGSKVRTVANAQHGRTLQFTIEQAHDAALGVFVERGCGFVGKNPAGLIQRRDHTTPWACCSKVQFSTFPREGFDSFRSASTSG